MALRNQSYFAKFLQSLFAYRNSVLIKHFLDLLKNIHELEKRLVAKQLVTHYWADIEEC